MRNGTVKKQNGLTLVEVIIALVVLAVLAAMMVPYFGTSFTQSGTPVNRLKNSQSLNMVMEKIASEYSKYHHWRPSNYYAAGTVIMPSTQAGFGDLYSSGGGTSGTSEPHWRIRTGTTVTDNTITWTYYGAAPTLADLKTCIGTEGQNYSDASPAGACKFGSYRVLENHFIKFDDSTNTEVDLTGNTSDPKYGRFLKVTIGFRSDDTGGTGEKLSTLFTVRY